MGPKNVKAELQSKLANSSYVLRREQGKRNRASQTGESVHAGGSISFTGHHLRMKKHLGRDLTFRELFDRTHLKRGTREYVDTRSASLNDTITRLKERASSHGSTSTSGAGESLDDNALGQLQWW